MSCLALSGRLTLGFETLWEWICEERRESVLVADFI